MRTLSTAEEIAITRANDGLYDLLVNPKYTTDIGNDDYAVLLQAFVILRSLVENLDDDRGL